MPEQIYYELTRWQIAMVADGRRAITAKDRAGYVAAVARTVGKTPDTLTDSDVSTYAALRGLKQTTYVAVAKHVRNFRRFCADGHLSNYVRYVSAKDLAPYQRWLEAGKYTSTRRLGSRRMATSSANVHAAHVASIATRFKVHPTKLTTAHMEKWLEEHAHNNETYRNRALRAVRYYAQFAAVPDPTADVMRFAEPQEQPRPRPASHECVAALLASPDPFVVAMATLGAAAGLRRAEIGMVRGTDFTWRNGRWHLRVQGKGNKVRTVVMGAHSMTRIAAVCTPGKSRDRLFPHLPADPTKAGTAVGDILAEAAHAAGYTMTAHQLRHYAATTLFDATRDLEAVRRMLGHSNMQTTMRYVEAWTNEVANGAADALDDAIARLAAA